VPAGFSLWLSFWPCLQNKIKVTILHEVLALLDDEYLLGLVFLFVNFEFLVDFPF
jgi:hypothetical protein